MLGENFVDRTGHSGLEMIFAQHQPVIQRIDNSFVYPHKRLWFCSTLIHGFSSIATYTETLKSQGQIPSLKLVAMLDAGWNSTHHHCLRPVWHNTFSPWISNSTTIIINVELFIYALHHNAFYSHIQNNLCFFHILL